MFTAKPLTRTTKAAYHLVGNEQDPVLVDDALDLRPVGIRGDDQPAGALHRFADEGGHALGADLQDLLLELTGAREAELRRRQVAALAEPVRLVDVGYARQGAVRTQLLVH